MISPRKIPVKISLNGNNLTEIMVKENEVWDRVFGLYKEKIAFFRNGCYMNGKSHVDGPATIQAMPIMTEKIDLQTESGKKEELLVSLKRELVSENTKNMELSHEIMCLKEMLVQREKEIEQLMNKETHRKKEMTLLRSKLWTLTHSQEKEMGQIGLADHFVCLLFVFVICLAITAEFVINWEC